jgi:hypothetical protein
MSYSTVHYFLVKGEYHPIRVGHVGDAYEKDLSLAVVAARTSTVGKGVNIYHLVNQFKAESSVLSS